MRWTNATSTNIVWAKQLVRSSAYAHAYKYAYGHECVPKAMQFGRRPCGLVRSMRIEKISAMRASLTARCHRICYKYNMQILQITAVLSITQKWFAFLVDLEFEPYNRNNNQTIKFSSFQRN